MNPLGQNPRRPVFLVAVLLCLLWLVFRAVPAGLYSIREAHWSLEDRVNQLVRSREELRAVPGMEDSSRNLQAALVAQAPRLVASGSESEATDALTGLVSAIVTGANAKLNRTERMADSAASGYLKGVALLASFDSDIGGTMAVLRALSSEHPLVTVQSLTVMVADPNSARTDPEVLRVELLVRGWYLVREGT